MTYEVKVVTMPGDAPRRLLREQAMRAMGAEAADVLMEHLPPAGWADLARRSDVEHETALLRLEIGTLRAEMSGEFAALRAEMSGEFATVWAEMSGGLSTLAEQLRTEIQTAIAAQTRWMVSVLLVLGALYTTVTILGR
ncbi:MAG: hypothetical protein M4D85_02395 [Actinomycetota bacterium]|nr:hypothetical protein [Actinomycetota bacterium]